MPKFVSNSAQELNEYLSSPSSSHIKMSGSDFKEVIPCLSMLTMIEKSHFDL